MVDTGAPNHFGDWLRQRRAALDLTQAELADLAGCSIFAIRKIEAGDRRPSKQLAALLADSLEIPEAERSDFIRVARGDLSLERTAPAVTAPKMEEQSPTETPAYVDNLPPSLTPFVGRMPEIERIGGMLRDPHCRMVTLVGPGGIGKTRLAVEAAAILVPFFPDGVFFVPLAPLSASAFLVTAIADTLGLRLAGSEDTGGQLIEKLSDRRLLLVLDNAEHVLDGVTLFSDILENAPRVMMLVTSRERLNLSSEWVLELAGLPVANGSDIQGSGQAGAVELFVQSAQRMQSDFSLSEADLPWVRRICRAVDGLPLGIELASAWVTLLSCQEIAKEIEKNLDFVSAEIRDIPARHRSLRAVFDHSWQLLSEEGRDALRRLSVFRGGFEREAAAQVAGATLPILSALMRKSFLRRSNVNRLDLHEVVRQFGYEKLESSGQRHQTCSRHLDYLVGLAREAQGELRGPSPAAWYERLELEYDNIRAALTWAFDPDASPERVEHGLQLVLSITRFWQGRGHVLEAVLWLEKGLQASRAISPSLRANALAIAGWLAVYLNDCDKAHQMLDQSVAEYRQLNDVAGLARALDIQGDISWNDGDFEAGRDYYAESLALLRKQGDPVDIGLSLYSTGRLHVDYGHYLEGEAFLKEGLSLLKSVPDWRGVAMCLNGLGRLALYQADLERASQQFREALRLNFQLGHHLSLTECLQELAVIALRREKESRATRLWSAATALRERMGVSFPANDPFYRELAPDWFEAIAKTPEWRAGREMALEQVIDLALSEEDAAGPGSI